MPRLIVPLVLGLWLLSAASYLGQEKSPDPKTPKSDPKNPPGIDPKTNPPKTDPKNPETGPKAPPPLDELKLPPNAIVISVEDLKGVRFPKMVYMTWEAYQKQQEDIERLERQLKPDKQRPHACRLSGKLDGDFLLLKAEVAFVTDEPRATVILGLQGAQLTDEGDLDKQAPWLDVTADGYVVQVEKEGPHLLSLGLKIPVLPRRSPATGGNIERGFDLGLPGAAVTTLALEMPPAVKEIRANDTPEKSRTPGHWDLVVGKAKQINVSWKEPAAAAGGGPLVTVESQVTVRLEESFALIKADIFLEDLRGQTKEWPLLLPPQARVEVKGPATVSAEVLSPDAKNPLHRLRLVEPSSERLHLQVQAHVLRPAGPGKLAIGPFHAPGAFRQQGTVTVHALAEGLRGQRLIYHRHGETLQRDVVKSPATADVAAMFQFWNVSGPTKVNPQIPAGVPLEIELKTDKGNIETSVDHELRLKAHEDGWALETDSRIKVKAAYPGTDVVNVQMPLFRLPGRKWLLGAIPGTPFPAGWPMGLCLGPADAEDTVAYPVEMFAEEEGGAAPEIEHLGVPGRARIKLARPQGKDFSIRLKGRYWLPGGTRRALVELPSPLGYVDRGGKTLVKVEDQLELFAGPPGAEAPSPDKHQAQATWEQAPRSVQFSWRPYQAEVTATSWADVVLKDTVTEVTQRLHLAVPSRPGQTGGQIRLRAPPAAQHLKLLSGGKLQQDGEVAWVVPHSDVPGKVELTLEYVVPLPAAAPEQADTPFVLPLIAPLSAGPHEVKVRVWAPPQLWPTLDAAAAWSGNWTARGSEVVLAKSTLPAFVATGHDAQLPLRLLRGAGETGGLAGWLCERGLIQVRVDEEGAHHYRAKYFIRKISAAHVDVEFPIPAGQCELKVRIGKKDLPWHSPQAPWTVARIEGSVLAVLGEPFLLELDYAVPASFGKGKRFWQTTLHAPVFQGHLPLPRLRWHISWSTPGGVIFPWEKDLAVDFRWSVQSWLLGPAPAVSSAELEAWPAGPDAEPVHLTLWRSGTEPMILMHFPRQLWLLLCSGLFVAAALLVYVVPWPRWLRWGVVLAVVTALTGLLLYWPAWAPVLFLGLQPGLLVVGLLLVVHWYFRERYRRQLVFMPGFTRTKAGSSLMRPKSSSLPREAPTIDVPPPALAAFAPAHSELKPQ